MSYINIIFLDIDGVLSTERYMRVQALRSGKSTNDYEFQFNFDPIATDNLKEIVACTNANIVISSTWRIKRTNNSILWDELLNNMTKLGLKERIIGTTPIIFKDKRSNNRAIEIQQWLLDNKERDIKRFVIIDDTWDMGEYSSTNLARCWSYSGITAEIKEKAINILSI